MNKASFCVFKLMSVSISVLMGFYNTAFADRIPLTAWLGLNQNTMDVSHLILPNAQSNTLLTNHAGITTDFPLGDMFALRSGAFYNQRNNSFYYSSITGDVSINYTYLDIPFDLILLGKNFSLMAGVVVGIKTSGHTSGSGFWSSLISNATTITDNSIICPMHAGLSYRFKKRFEVQLIYEQSVLRSTLVIAGGSPSLIKSSTVGIQLGYANF